MEGAYSTPSIKTPWLLKGAQGGVVQGEEQGGAKCHVTPAWTILTLPILLDKMDKLPLTNVSAREKKLKILSWSEMCKSSAAINKRLVSTLAATDDQITLRALPIAMVIKALNCGRCFVNYGRFVLLEKDNGVIWGRIDYTVPCVCLRGRAVFSAIR